MSGPSPVRMELARADGGRDLWTVIEAAQFAKLLDHGRPRTDGEAERLRSFVDLFEDCAEGWDGRSASEQTMALEQFDHRLAALGQLDLRVYSAVARFTLEAARGGVVRLPLAVVAIRRDDRPSISLDLPRTAGVG